MVKQYKVKRGDKVRVIQAGTTGLQQIPYGHIFTVAGNGIVGSMGNISVYQSGDSGPTWGIHAEDVTIAYYTKEELEEDRKELAKSIEDIDSKLEYIVKKKVKEVDPDDFMRWRVENIVTKHKENAPEMIFELFAR
jgi:hypothetical protein